jgi:acetylornithine deacetylase/succinyl-diaminopimelate desuccinylase-like protein
LDIARPEALGQTYEEAMQYPTLNIRGMQSGWIGKEVRTVIPATATAEIDIRLVPEIEGQKMVDLVSTHLLKQGITLVKNPPTDEERADYPELATFQYKLGSRPFRTDMDSELGRWLNRAMPRAVDKHINIRATGGSQPIATFIETLDVPAVSVRIPNPDNNIHGPNENIRLGNYMEGIKMCLAVLTESL